MWLNTQEGFRHIDALGKTQTPFLFIVSYDKTKVFVQPLDTPEEDVFYKLDNWRNFTQGCNKKTVSFSSQGVDFTQYQRTFEAVLEEIRSGNTYLLNLTFKTPIQSSLTLKEIFTCAKAKYKLYYKNEFICFSPESFIEIENNTIATYPMKGTIDAGLPDAEQLILNDPKETAEHVMIVDLMRNDLGMVGTHVKVENFRYTQKIQAGNKELLQVSSKITATLPSDWREHLGELLDTLLPAGSISGTPKKSTLQIIKDTENYDREFYSGVFGVFDGDALRSGVMIRFIEQKEGALFYKSGGGITLDSTLQNEYNELLDKIYLPL